MKNSQKGSATPYLIAIIALLLIGGGYYIFTLKSQTYQSGQSTVPAPSVTIDSSANGYPTKPTVTNTVYSTNQVPAVPPITPTLSDVLVSPGPSRDADLYKLSGSGFGKTSIVNVTLISSPFPNVVFPKYYNNIHPTAFTSSSLTFTFPSFSAGSSPGTYSVQVVNSNSAGVTKTSNTKTFAITPPTGM